MGELFRGQIWAGFQPSTHQPMCASCALPHPRICASTLPSKQWSASPLFPATPLFWEQRVGGSIPPPRPLQAIEISSDMADSCHASAFSRYSTVVKFVAVNASVVFQLHFNETQPSRNLQLLSQDIRAFASAAKSEGTVYLSLNSNWRPTGRARPDDRDPHRHVGMGQHRWHVDE